MSTLSLESQLLVDASNGDGLEPMIEEHSMTNAVGQTMLTLDDVIESDVELLD